MNIIILGGGSAGWLAAAYLSKTNKVKYYLIAGEASGDLHGSKLIKAIKTQSKHN